MLVELKALLTGPLLFSSSGEGGQLGNFYKKLKNGDKFDIFVKNFKGA